MRNTNLQRVMAAIKLCKPDTIPTFELGIDEKVINAIKPGLSYYDFCEYMDLDAVCYSEIRFDQVLDEARGVIRDEWGAVQQFSSAGMLPIPREPAIKDRKDIDGYISPNPDLPSRLDKL